MGVSSANDNTHYTKQEHLRIKYIYRTVTVLNWLGFLICAHTHFATFQMGTLFLSNCDAIQEVMD